MKQESRRSLVIARVLLVAGTALASGCSSFNTHPELSADPTVMVRQWTLDTSPTESYKAGSRGYELSQPVIADQTVILGNRSVGLLSLYPKYLLSRWRLPIAGGVVSETLVYEGSVYFGAGDGFLYSVSQETGRVQWRYDLHNPIVSRPAVSGGRVVVTTSDDTVFALDAGSGKWLWNYRRRSSGQATVLGASAPLIDGADVLTGLSDGYLVAIGLADGSLKWERKLSLSSKFTDVDSTPVLEPTPAGGILYVSSYDGALYALKRQGGEVIWRFDSGAAREVTLDGDRIYLPSSDGTVYCLQKSNAKVLWKFDLDRGSPTRVTIAGDRVAFGSSHQYLYVLDRASGRAEYRFNAGFDAGFYGGFAYDSRSRRLYALSSGGNLYTFALRAPRAAKPGAKPLGRAPGDPYVWADPAVTLAGQGLEIGRARKR